MTGRLFSFGNSGNPLAQILSLLVFGALLAVAAMLVVLNSPVDTQFAGSNRLEAAAECVQGLLYYLVVYFFMNLGVFAIVAFVVVPTTFLFRPGVAGRR